jgi:hypothetical protein
MPEYFIVNKRLCASSEYSFQCHYEHHRQHNPLSQSLSYSPDTFYENRLQSLNDSKVEEEINDFSSKLNSYDYCNVINGDLCNMIKQVNKNKIQHFIKVSQNFGTIERTNVSGRISNEISDNFNSKFNFQAENKLLQEFKVYHANNHNANCNQISKTVLQNYIFDEAKILCSQILSGLVFEIDRNNNFNWH